MTQIEVDLPTPSATADRPLFVDLDGTLVKSDTLFDSVLLLARERPALLLSLPKWLAAGKASLKAHVSESVSLDVGHLPYNRELLTYLRQQQAEGRPLYLATGADTRLAHRIAKHLAIFSGVFASDGVTNLTSHNKLEGLRRFLPEGEFDYIGNAVPDLPLLLNSTEPMVANPDSSLRASLRLKQVHVVREFQDRAAPVKSFLRAIRLHQWSKNVLLFVPLLLSHAIHAKALERTSLAFLCFSLCASATYIVNDLLDLDPDRRHPRKRHRPFAAGDLSAFTGLSIVGIFLAAGFFSAWWLSINFLGWLLGYFVTTLAYSLALKRLVLVDVLLLSGLYTVRMLAGAAVTGTTISPWLAGFSLFLFLSLAMVKRFSELQNLRATSHVPENGRGYLLQDIEQIRSFGTASAYASVVVFTLYISGHDIASLYSHPHRMWLITPLLILWVSRFWLLASRGELNEDPVVFALTDRTSVVIGAGIVGVALFSL
ncbi:UbiA family prenyltransferase [Acidisarcina polymorpha]|nr:UbiA family prenyltransferase [Acidisarcina polymorpha]